jgi:peptidoglycan hydrolase-like protein with peptidoglycan-binding domain
MINYRHTGNRAVASRRYRGRVTRRIFTYVTAGALALTLLAGCGPNDDPDVAAPAPTTTAQAPAGPTPSAAAPGAATPTPEPSKSAPTTSPTPLKLKSGAKGPQVVALQQRLTELGYWNGTADGMFGGVTQQAVFALQKTAGLTRDGVVGPKTQRALDRGVRPKAKSTSGHVVEIDKKRQILMLVDDGNVSTILNTSTGSGEHYEYEGNTYLASTPSGHFTAGRQIDGWRHGPLGPLWRPKYFNGGIAVHGAPVVPPYPASHGCARVSILAMNWIWANEKMPLKTKVWVY